MLRRIAALVLRKLGARRPISFDQQRFTNRAARFSAA
jgi:hypothetical protein